MILASSFSPVHEQFEGFCFYGADYIAGEEGFLTFTRETGHQIVPDLDGCYAFTQKQGDDWIFGSDSRGLSKLFYFQNGSAWAVSTSCAQLVTHLRRNGVSIEPNFPHLASLGARHSFTTQLSSLETLFKEVHIAPSFSVIRVVNGKIILEHRPEAEELPYDDALADYIGMWRARMDTLLADERVHFKIDLSGGVDSRTALAFALSSPRFDPLSERHVVISSKNRTADFQCAQTIAVAYGFSLNEGRFSAPRVLDEEAAYKTWWNHSLAGYLPSYLSRNRFNPFNVHGHGAGGGNNRFVYSEVPIDHFLRRFANTMPAHFYPSWRDSVVESMEYLSALRPKVPASILHYREFRNRFHFGHRPHSEAVFTPVNSILLDAITDSDEENFRSRQVFFDVMESLAPGLIDYPYDQDSKAPSKETLSRIRRIDFQEEIQSGSVYASVDPEDGDGRNGEHAYYRWLAECVESLNDKAVRSFIGDDVVSRSEEFLKSADAERVQGPFHTSRLDLSYARTVDFVLNA